jgi:rhamnulokinase
LVTVVAFDLGATSGRAVLGRFTGDRLIMNEIHRFSNRPVQLGHHLYWDILQLYDQLIQGLLKSQSMSRSSIASLGIDSWAVDFGLLSKQGDLLGNPIHYRDHQTDGMMEKVFRLLPREEIYLRTGIQFMQINTLYHLYAMRVQQSPLLEQADALLMIPDLLRYFLTGEKVSEFTNATTTQLFHVHQKQWDRELLHKLDLPAHLFQSVVQPGTEVGGLRSSLQQSLGLAKIPVIAVAEHDTASAVASIPTEQVPFAYLSCGTWSLLGTEVNQPVVNEQALAWNFTNEGGFGQTYRLLKNIMGLWLVEECKRVWEQEHQAMTYQELMQQAQEADAFQSFIDPDDDCFLHPDHMPNAIQRYCQETNQIVPRTPGQVIRCILESLALKYRFVFEKTESLIHHRFSQLHVVGGGSKNRLLCQFTANAIGRPVWAGPTEGTAIGNILVQLIRLGYLKNIQEARQVVRNSFPIQIYEPQEEKMWSESYERFCTFINRRK